MFDLNGIKNPVSTDSKLVFNRAKMNEQLKKSKFTLPPAAPQDSGT